MAGRKQSGDSGRIYGGQTPVNKVPTKVVPSTPGEQRGQTPIPKTNPTLKKNQ